MDLIIGGAFQGKLCYARSVYKLTENDICDCTKGPLDFSRRCICHLEAAVWNCLQAGQDPKTLFAENRDLWKDSVIICNDISAGVVPMDTEVRAWREAVGRVLNDLAPQANAVIRMFCGLPQRLKG